MTRAIALACGAVVLAASLMFEAATAVPLLPFYDSPDFTPRWSAAVSHRIADFALVSQTGRPLARADLLGRPHVATFIYTSCAGVCPAMIGQLRKVQDAVDGAGAMLVSYTVTPQHDTPETLARFGEARGIDADRWKLVTGDVAQIYALARTSYFADDGRTSAVTVGEQPFLHTEKALLVDADGRLRGVYNATVPHDVDKLIDDLTLLTEESARRRR